MEFVSVLMGSKSDMGVMIECVDILKKFGVPYEMIISSAHRSPERTKNYILDAEKRGAKIFIAAAGMAAHLAGAVAASTTKPVIGVPMGGGAMGGMDALLSTVQMPSGMPVGTVAIGKAGAINSAYMAIQILSINNKELENRLKEDREAQKRKVEEDSAIVEVLI